MTLMSRWLWASLLVAFLFGCPPDQDRAEEESGSEENRSTGAGDDSIPLQEASGAETGESGGR